MGSDRWSKPIALQPEHISAYCLTYEEDTEFFLRHARGEFRAGSGSGREFFETAMRMLEAAGYEHYEISNYARPGFASAHNRGYWAGDNYLGIGPSAFSTVGTGALAERCRLPRLHRRVLAGASTIVIVETLTPEMKRAEQIALSLAHARGVPAGWLAALA